MTEVTEAEIVVRPKLSFADAELQEFDRLLAKAKAGATVTATVRVADEAAVEELRGKDVTVEIKVLEVKKHELPEMTPGLHSAILAPSRAVFPDASTTSGGKSIRPMRLALVRST